MHQEQMYFEQQKECLNKIEELTRLKVITSKSILSKRFQAVTLSHHNLLSCMEMMVQTFSLVMLAHQNSLQLRISTKIFREKASGNVFAYYELVEAGQSFTKKFGEEFNLYTQDSLGEELLKLNVTHYDILYHILSQADRKVAELYNSLARYFYEKQQQISKGQIDESEIIAYLQTSPIFLQFSLNQRLFNTLIAFSINDHLTYPSFADIFADKKELFSKDIIDFQDKNGFVLMIKKQLTTMFTLFAINAIVCLEGTVDQNEQMRKKREQMDMNVENSEVNLFRSKCNEWNLIKFSLRINQRYFNKQQADKQSSQEQGSFSLEEEMSPTNIFSAGRDQSELQFKVKISFETYLYKERSDCWVISTSLRMPIMMKSLDFLQANSMWAQLLQNPCFNSTNRNIFLEEDPKSNETFLSQRFKIEDMRKVDILSEIVNRSDELIIIYLCLEPALLYFSRNNHYEGPRDQGEIEQQKMAYLSDDQLQRIARKTARAVGLYNTMLRAKKLNKYAIISESIRSCIGAL